MFYGYARKKCKSMRNFYDKETHCNFSHLASFQVVYFYLFIYLFSQSSILMKQNPANVFDFLISVVK